MRTSRKLLSTRAHGAIDYLAALLLLAFPLFPFSEVPSEEGVIWLLPAVLGGILLVSTFLTNFEYGVVKIIPVPAHLTLDYIAGLFLAVSPWLFQFSGRVYWPHLLVGLAIFLLAAVTSRQPGSGHWRERTHSAHVFPRD